MLYLKRSGKVFLPYKKEEVKQILEQNDNYDNEQKVIKDKFIVPIKKYKFPTSARFKEAYELIKNREKGSVFEAISLGMELSRLSELHPAVITACKNLDELDIYLSYLETNELEKFDIFDVVFEIPPM